MLSTRTRPGATIWWVLASITLKARRAAVTPSLPPSTPSTPKDLGPSPEKDICLTDRFRGSAGEGVGLGRLERERKDDESYDDVR